MKSGQMGLASQSRGRAGHGPTGGDFSGHSQPRGGATGCLHLILSLQARLGSSRAAAAPVAWSLLCPSGRTPKPDSSGQRLGTRCL